MTAEGNAALMRTVYEAFEKGDFEALNRLIAPEFVWHIPGQSPVAGDHKGFAALADVISKLMELSNGTLRSENHDALGSPDHGVNLDRLTATRGNKRLDMPMAFVAHIKDGRVTEAWDMFSDTHAWDEFWS